MGLRDGCNSYLVLNHVEAVHHITHEKTKCLLNKDIYITEYILFGYLEKKTAQNVQAMGHIRTMELKQIFSTI